MSFIRIVGALACAGAGAFATTAYRRASPADDHVAHMAAGDLAAPATASTKSQGLPGLPPSNATAAARLAASPRHGEWVKLAWEPGSRDSLMAWIVYPTTSNARTPVVVVVQEIFGLTSWIRGVADQVAADGFIAIAPDFFSKARGGPSTFEMPPDSARRYNQSVTYAERNNAIIAAAKYAMSQPSAAPRYAVIGYCWGGSTVFAHAVNGGTTGYSGGVAFYGGFPFSNAGVPVADSVAKIKAPVMLLNGSKDARIASAMPAIDSMMKAKGKTYSAMNYEGATHGFLREQADPKAQRNEVEEQANVAASKDGWPRTLDFLRKNLGMK
jgi:carboxymethylenebutenolidase